MSENGTPEFQDPFLEGNEAIEDAIARFYANKDEEHFWTILDSVRTRMHEDGHFIIPVRFDEEEPGNFTFQGLTDKDGKLWHAAFTSQEEFEKGAKSEALSFFIDKTLETCCTPDYEAEGFIINPWGQSFMLTKDIAEKIIQADGGVEYIVPDASVTAEILEDGSYLKKAIEICNRNRTQWNVLRLFRILRDSFIWIPCNAIPDENLNAQFKEMLEAAGDDPEALVGKTFTSKGEVRFSPDILQNGDEFFFPVFSSADEMGEYGNHFSKVQRHFIDAIAMANNNERELVGIVINAFTEPFVVDKELFDLIRGMETNIFSPDSPE